MDRSLNPAAFPDRLGRRLARGCPGEWLQVDSCQGSVVSLSQVRPGTVSGVEMEQKYGSPGKTSTAAPCTLLTHILWKYSGARLQVDSLNLADDFHKLGGAFPIQLFAQLLGG